MIQTLEITDKLQYFKPNDTKNLKVSFLSFGCPESISHWRSVVPAKSLAEIHKVHTNVIYTDVRKEVLDWSDIVVFQRLTGRFPEHLVNYCNLKNIVTIYDIDDNFFDYPNLEEYYDINDDLIRDDILSVLNKCDAVTVTTDALKRVLKSHIPDKNIYILPNSIDFNYWSKPVNKHDDIIKICYMGGNYHISDLNMILNTISDILKKYNNTSFDILGMGSNLGSIYPDRVTHHAPMDIKELPEFLAKNQYDIALAPLIDNPFSQCRSNIRLLQHSIFNTACVFSAVEPYKKSFESGFSGIMVDNTPESWFNGISKLIESSELRKNIATSSRNWVIKNYNITTNSIKWLRAYKDIMKKTH